MKTAIGGNEDIETPKDEKTGSENNIPKGKHYKCEKNNYLRYLDTYRSPIVKELNVIYNPQPGQSIPEGKIVVMSLNNYLASKKQG